MSQKVFITRRSKLGFGYTSCVFQTRTGLEVMPTTEPVHIGTVRQVSEAMANDKTLASYKSGGVSYSSAWFVWVNHEWRRVYDGYPLYELSLEFNNKYYTDMVCVEIE